MLTRARVALASPDGLRRLIDFGLASAIYALPQATRRRLFFGARHACPICGAQVRTFLRLNRPTFRWCPVCRSLQRHRLVWLLFERAILPRLPEQRRPRVLHFAPEAAIASRFHALAGAGYLSTDRYDTRAMVRSDICAAPISSGTIDIVYCSHVLEHVHDDQRAMRELWRVLRYGGVAVILVPLLGEHTFEDPQVTDPIERERVFGQHDHVRWYGSDITERLSQAGFSVQVVRTADLTTAAEVERFGLDHDETMFVCTHGAGTTSASAPEA